MRFGQVCIGAEIYLVIRDGSGANINGDIVEVDIEVTDLILLNKPELDRTSLERGEIHLALRPIGKERVTWLGSERGREDFARRTANFNAEVLSCLAKICGVVLNSICR